MLNIFKVELIKLKKTFIPLLMIITPLIVPMIISKNNISSSNFIATCLTINVLILFPLIINIVCSYIYSREFLDKNENIYFSYPLSPLKLILSKFFVLFILSLLMYSITIFSTLFMSKLSFQDFNLQLLLNENLSIFFKSFLLNMFICPITILLSIKSKNIFIPFGYSILLVLSNITIFTIFPIDKIKYCLLNLPAFDYFNLKFMESTLPFLEPQYTLIMFCIFLLLIYILTIVYKKLDL